jgi:hypothetical protein
MYKKICALLIACSLALSINADTQSNTSQSNPVPSTSYWKYATTVPYYGLAAYINYLAADGARNLLATRIGIVTRQITAHNFDPAAQLPVIVRTITVSAIVGCWVFNNMRSAYKSCISAQSTPAKGQQ